MTRHVTRMTINDAPHIGAEQRQAIIDSYPPHERDARVMGIPALGSGRVFPVAEEDITCAPMEIPSHWARIAGIDFGYDHPTAAACLAHDRDTDIVYVTACYRVREQPPLVHAAALKGWGRVPFAWPGDAFRRGSGDGSAGITLKSEYEGHGLNFLPERAKFNDGGVGVEPGLMIMLERMMSKRLRVFSNCLDWFDEFRQYHRNNGLIVKEYDDLMDATRYALMALRFAETETGYSKAWPQQDLQWVV